MKQDTDFIITLATRNEGKRRELERWLHQRHSPIRLALNESVGEIEETGSTFVENALIKAQATPPVVPGGWVLAEDSGLVVDALEGLYGLSPFPGLKSNRWLTPALRDTLLAQAYPNRMPLDRMTDGGVSNTDLCYGILTLLGQNANRSAQYCCGMVLWNPADGVAIKTMESVALWVIEGEPRGTHGFGYDPIMLLRDDRGEPSQHTIAELSADQKNQISHRGKAFQAILAALANQTSQ
jgi:XTP/dITP diphosphohydrolase